MSTRFIRKGQQRGARLMGHVPASLLGGGGSPVVPLTGAWLEPMVLETTDLTIGNLSDKGKACGQPKGKEFFD